MGQDRIKHYHEKRTICLTIDIFYVLQAVDRASNQTHQPTVTCEGLTAASVLVPLAQAEVELGESQV